MEKESLSRKISLVRKWWWRTTHAYDTVQMHINAVLVRGSVTTPLVQSFEEKVTTISKSLNAFRDDVRRVCSRYDDPDAYITLQARLLQHTIGNNDAQSTPVNLYPDASVPVLAAGRAQSTCPGTNANSNAIMSVGDAMATMSAFCGEVSPGIAQVLVLGSELDSRADVMDHFEFVKVLGREPTSLSRRMKICSYAQLASASLCRKNVLDTWRLPSKETL